MGIILTIPTLIFTLAGLSWWLHFIHTNAGDVWLSIAAICAGVAASAFIIHAIQDLKQRKDPLRRGQT